MPKIKLLVFDLDGTLFDTAADIADSVNHALDEYHVPTYSVSQIKKMIGHGARNLIENALGEKQQHLIDDALSKFLVHYHAYCTVRTQIYPGVLEFFNKVSHTPKALLTNKPKIPSVKILEKWNLQKEFVQAIFGDGRFPKKPEPLGLRYILKETNTDPDEALLIGDGVPDMLVARVLKVPSLAILGGYGDRHDLIGTSPSFVVEAFQEIANLIESLC